MNEQIFLGGRPVVGFGGATEAEEKKFYGTMVGIPLLGIVAGAGGGGALGYKAGGGWGAAGGALAGGIAGGVIGIFTAQGVVRATAEKRDVTGVGAAPVASSLPWGEIFASSVVSALAGLAIEEAAHSVRKRKRR